MKFRKIKVISSVTVINPETGEILHDHDIYIDNGKISGIEPSKHAGNLDILDGTGLFAIPGLIDTHVHALGFLNEDIPGIFDLRWIFRQQRKNLSYYLRSGVTTIRDMGSALKLIRKYSRKAAKFKIQAPRIVYAGPMFTIPGGYPHYVPKGPFYIRWFAGMIRVDLKEEKGEAYARKIVDKVAVGGAKYIKVMYQSAEYDDERTEIPIIPLSLLRVIVERAHDHGLPVGLHHTYVKDLRNLLDSDIPFDSIEHLTTDEELSDVDVKTFAERGIPISSTLMTYGIVYHADELEILIQQEPERFEKKPLRFFQEMCSAARSGGALVSLMSRNYMDTAVKFMSANLKKLFDAGVQIAYATDTGIMTPTGVPHWELNDMVKAGMTPLDALRSATNVAADVIGIPDLGRIEKRRIADIVLLCENPLDNIDAIGHVAAVIRDGYMVHKTSKSEKSSYKKIDEL